MRPMAGRRGIAPALATATLALGTAFSAPASAQSCNVRSSSDKTCTESYTSCVTKNDPAGCRSSRAECMRTGRWIWRNGPQCTDWGTRQKK